MTDLVEIERRKAMLEARRIEQRSRIPGIIKHNARSPLFNPLRQRALALPRLKTGKQYKYEGKR